MAPLACAIPHRQKKMIKKTYLRLALAIPLLLALGGWLLERADFANAISDFLILSMVIGGAPYLLTLIVLLAMSFKASLDRFEKWWFFSPFLMALMCGVCALGMTVFNGVTGGWEASLIPIFFAVWLMGGFYSLILGYVYVLLAAWVFVILQWAGFIRSVPNAFTLDTI